MLADEKRVLEFLAKLFNDEEASYSSVNTARSALSSFLWNESGLTIGKFNSVRRFMKGVYELRPPMPRYSFVWDVNIVLNFLKIFVPVRELPLCQLTFKLVMLLAITSAQRVQSLQLLNVDNIFVNGDIIYCVIDGLLKQSSIKRKNPLIVLKSYEVDPDICVVSSMKEYLRRTQTLRKNEKQLFISYQQPHSGVSKDTISRWIKMVLCEAGVEMDTFSAHSTRSAAASAAKRNGVDVEEILRAAGWASNAMFANFYNKPIQGCAFSDGVVQNH